MSNSLRIPNVLSWVWRATVAAGLFVLVCLVGFTLFSDSPHLIMWGTMIGEFAIALIIYVEVEAERASRFMDAVKDKSFYEDRDRLYDAYTHLPAGSFGERAEAFRELLWKDEKLRGICDYQWTEISRLRYMMSGSLHRRLLSKWMPQVLVSFWVMTNRYRREHNKMRPAPIADYGVLAVRESLRELEKLGLPTVTIYAKDRASAGTGDVKISAQLLKEMLADLDAPFKLEP